MGRILLALHALIPLLVGLGAFGFAVASAIVYDELLARNRVDVALQSTDVVQVGEHAGLDPLRLPTLSAPETDGLPDSSGQRGAEADRAAPATGTAPTASPPAEPQRPLSSSRGGNRPRLDDGLPAPAGAAAKTEPDVSKPPDEPAASPAEKRARPFQYRVGEGDTVFGLADRFGISPETIAWANDLGDRADHLQLGQRITILPVSGVLHKVKAGDTIDGIASAHGVDVAAIVRGNDLLNPDAIALGEDLVVPGARPTEPLQPTKPAPMPPGRVDSARPVEAPAKQPESPAASPPANGSSGKGEAIVAVASRYAGYPYTWGGHSPESGFDCTGFTWYVYKQAGVTIPLHDLWGQLGAGPRVRQDQLLPGDLVFFQNTYMPGLSHSGLYAGGGRFIHAASEGKGVRYDRLDDPYWGPRFFGASRPW